MIFEDKIMLGMKFPQIKHTNKLAIGSSRCPDFKRMHLVERWVPGKTMLAFALFCRTPNDYVNMKHVEEGNNVMHNWIVRLPKSLVLLEIMMIMSLFLVICVLCHVGLWEDRTAVAVWRGLLRCLPPGLHWPTGGALRHVQMRWMHFRYGALLLLVGRQTHTLLAQCMLVVRFW